MELPHTDEKFSLIPKENINDSDNSSEGHHSSRLRFWGQLVIQLTILLIAEASRGLVLPSIFLYVLALGGDKRTMGFVVAAFSLGRLVGGIGLGWLYNHRGTRFALYSALIISIIGHFLYAVAQISNVWMLLISRILVGFGTGSLSVVRAIIAAETTKEQRVRFMAFAGAIQFVGFAIVPAVALILVFDEFHVLGLPINQFTIPAYILLLANIIILVITFFLVKDTQEEPPRPQEEHKLTDIRKQRRGKIYGIILFLILNFVCRGVISLVETVGGMMYLQLDPEYDQNDHPNNVFNSSKMFSILGCFGLIFFFVVDWLRKCLPDLVILTVSLFFLTAGCILLVPWGQPIQMWHFYLGSSFIWSISSPLTQTLVISSFSKLLDSNKQGTMMGLIGAAGSVGRMVIPSMSGFLSVDANFIVSAVFSAISAVATLIFSCCFGLY